MKSAAERLRPKCITKNPDN